MTTLALAVTLAGCSSSPASAPDTSAPGQTSMAPQRPAELTTAIEAAKAADRVLRARAQDDGSTTPRASLLVAALAEEGLYGSFGAGRELLVWGLSPERTPVLIWDRTAASGASLATAQQYLRFDVPGASACLRLGVDPDRHIENAPAIDGELAADPDASAVVAVSTDDSACAAFWPQ